MKGFTKLLVYILQVYLIECQHGSDDVEDEDLVQSSGSGDEYFAPVTSVYKVKVVVPPVIHGHRLPDNIAIRRVQEIVARAKTSAWFESAPFLVSRNKTSNTILIYGTLTLPISISFETFRVEISKSQLLFSQIVIPGRDITTTKQSSTTDYQIPSSTLTPTQSPPSSTDGEGVDKPSSNFFLQNPAILAAVISALIAAVFCVVLCAVFIICRMKKKDRGTMELDSRMGTINGAASDPRNMYLFNKPQCREIYA